MDRGTNLVELNERFGAQLIKGKLIYAQQKIEDQKAKSDDHGLVDLVNEDKYVRDRLEPKFGEQNAKEAKMDYDYLLKNQKKPKSLNDKQKTALHEQLHKIVKGALQSRVQSDYDLAIKKADEEFHRELDKTGEEVNKHMPEDQILKVILDVD